MPIAGVGQKIPKLEGLIITLAAGKGKRIDFGGSNRIRPKEMKIKVETKKSSQNDKQKPSHGDDFSMIKSVDDISKRTLGEVGRC